MERLKAIKDQLLAQVEAQMGDLKCVDTKELGEVIDMIKDLAQTMYYYEVYKAMEEKSEWKEEEKNSNNYYYTEKYLPWPTQIGRMYYPEEENPTSGMMKNYSSRYGNEPGRSEEYYEREYPLQYLRDEREGRSPIKRKMYMESKATNPDSSKAMKDLESYMQDLTSDMIEMLDKATPEERAIVQKKINILAAKIQNV